MRIFFSPDGSDPMILDSESGLQAIHGELASFLQSPRRSLDLPAATAGSPQPYATFLRGLRVSKTDRGLRLTLEADGWLSLEGCADILVECAKRFLVSEKQGHTHIYAAPISLIIECDNQRAPELSC